MRFRRRAAVAIACALLLSGCGVRFDAPPPTEPVPDPVEIVRRTAVDDALHVAEQAEAVAALRKTRPKVAETLTDIAEVSRRHADQLGGEYESGLQSDPPSPTPTELAEIPPGAGAVLTTLSDAAARSATAADVCEDGTLARLLASISAAQTLSARKLAAATGRPQPAYTPPVVPGSGDETAPAPSAAPSDDGADATEESDTTTAALTPSARPTTPPVGVAEADLVAIILAEDSTAYALEVRAAQADDETVRERLANRAETHRRRAEGWARVAGVDGTGADPRRAAYELPGAEVTSQDVLLQAEGRIAAGYASLVGLAEADTRAVAVALLTDSAIAQNSWGAPMISFPGLPEQAAS
ncbi:DUF4439 domain-containing protein [Myceligenerans pegani]|uniref:DUF4439 domain-containing protein n=1 Tax=Myceligenerans pegani TaxID=2776917 RepID=UPI0018681C26|nr:DUF4439 domain-containing protein [Myceligenerans sp. TRM 65318]MBE3016775.1 DUF4439 domain-containing protein [Myceligenerans sp. TRM 65318]